MKEVLLSTMKETARVCAYEPVGGKCNCVRACVFLHACLSGCIEIFKGCWPLKGSHLFDMFGIMLFSPLCVMCLCLGLVAFLFS